MEAKMNYAFFEQFIETFLVGKKSIFTNKTDIILTHENLDFIIEKFKNGFKGDSNQSFDDKLSVQLEDASENQKVLFAHVSWLWSVFAADISIKRKEEDISKFVKGEWIKNRIPPRGIGSTGQYHKTNKHHEYCYILDFFKKALDVNSSTNSEQYISILKELDNTEKVGNSEKRVAMYNILLHLFSPYKYERIASYGHKKKIISFFTDVFEDLNFSSKDEEHYDEQLAVIRARCENDERFKGLTDDYGLGPRFDFYHKDIDFWKSEIVIESKNMILHGAPGTGKTYGVEKSIKSRLALNKKQNDSNQFVLVQFHPSYGYEDFIDGIKPKGIDTNGALKFELVNGAFKDMCINGMRELYAAHKEGRIARKFYFVADEINRAEISRVFGELLLCIEEDKRLRFVDGKIQGTMVKTQNANLWNQNHAVVTLKNGEFNVDGNEYYFGVPENLVFIGTMNDIDRSVDSFDMALRRRFFWKHTECDYEVIAENYKNYPRVDDYIANCKKLNEHIVSMHGFNLGDSYQLGHSYFLKPNKITKSEIRQLWDNHITPLLTEYLRSEIKESEIKSKLKEAYQKFSGGL